MNRQLITNVRTAKIKAIGKLNDVASVEIGCGSAFGITHGYNVTMTLRAFSSLVKLTQDITGAYDLELLRYSTASATLVTDVIVITEPKAKD